MATIFTSRDVNLILNGQSIFCNNISLFQQANIKNPYQLNESVNFKNISESAVTNELNFSFFFTGKDFLFDYASVKNSFPLSGYIAGINFNQGYLKSYSLNATPHSLLVANASILICNELSGSLNKIISSGPPTGVSQWTTNDLIFETNDNFSAFKINENNIESINWNFNSEVKPIYYYKQTGLNHINPDRIYVGQKEISCDIVTKDINSNLLLPFTGQNFYLKTSLNNVTTTTLASGGHAGSSQDTSPNVTIIDLTRTGILNEGIYTANFEYKFTDSVDTTGTVYPLIAIKTGSLYMPILVGSGVTYAPGTSQTLVSFGQNNIFKLPEKTTIYGGFHCSGITAKNGPIGYIASSANAVYAFYGGTESLPQPLSPIIAVSNGFFPRNYNFLIKVSNYPPTLCEISGKINKKTFSAGVNEFGAASYSVTQTHLNNPPKIESVDISTYPNNNYILINSHGPIEGFHTNYHNYSIVEKVILGDSELKFTTDRKIPYDTITGYITNDSINGSLQIHTSKGLLIYPSGINLNFSGIGVSGFYPETGNYHDTILISGTNFYRITQVLFNNISTNFQIKQNTGIGGFHEIIASVPDDATIGKIAVISSLKNRSGISTGNFYPIIEITGLTPTGIWSGTCLIDGKNFSGITNVYFNKIKSPSFTVNSTIRVTATLPGTGQGFTKGNIRMSGFQGMVGDSYSIYHPIVPIYGLSTISGTSSEDMAVYTIFDKDYLHNFSGDGYTGYKFAIGRSTGILFRLDESPTTLTGLIPTGRFNNQYLYLYEPDGVTRYPPYPTAFAQVGPPPIITDFYPKTVKLFDNFTLNLEGENFKDFFSLPYYSLLSGVRQGQFNPAEEKTGIYTYSTIYPNDIGTKVQIPNVSITGVTGYYDIYLFNYAGTGSITGFKVEAPVDVANLYGMATQSSNWENDFNAVAKYAIDNNLDSRSSTDYFRNTDVIDIGQDINGWWSCSMGATNQTVNIRAISIYQSPNLSDIVQLTEPPRTVYLATTGLLQIFDINLINIYESGVDWNDSTFDFSATPIEGAKILKLSVNAPDEFTRLAFNDIKVLGTLNP